MFRTKIERSGLMNGVGTIVRSQDTLKVLAKELEVGAETSTKLKEEVAIREVDSTKDTEVEVMIPSSNVLSNRVTFALARLGGSARKIHKQRVIAKESKLVQ